MAPLHVKLDPMRWTTAFFAILRTWWGQAAIGLTALYFLLRFVSDARGTLDAAKDIYELAATPWIVLFWLAVVVGLLWKGVVQVREAAKRGSEIDRQAQVRETTARAAAIGEMEARFSERFAVVDHVGVLAIAAYEKHQICTHVERAKAVVNRIENFFDGNEKPAGDEFHDHWQDAITQAAENLREVTFVLPQWSPPETRLPPVRLHGQDGIYRYRPSEHPNFEAVISHVRRSLQRRILQLDAEAEKRTQVADRMLEAIRHKVGP